MSETGFNNGVTGEESEVRALTTVAFEQLFAGLNILDKNDIDVAIIVPCNLDIGFRSMIDHITHPVVAMFFETKRETQRCKVVCECLDR